MVARLIVMINELVSAVSMGTVEVNSKLFYYALNSNMVEETGSPLFT